MNCLVTVGSTQFDALIKSVLNEKFLNLLHLKGFKQLNIQCGSGKIDESFVKFYENDAIWSDKRYKIDVSIKYNNIRLNTV